MAIRIPAEKGKKKQHLRRIRRLLRIRPKCCFPLCAAAGERIVPSRGGCPAPRNAMRKLAALRHIRSWLRPCPAPPQQKNRPAIAGRPWKGASLLFWGRRHGVVVKHPILHIEHGVPVRSIAHHHLAQAGVDHHPHAHGAGGRIVQQLPCGRILAH